MINAPPLLQRLIAAVGDDAVLRFVEGHGGQRLWVPGKPDGSQLASLYGVGLARALSAEFGGDYINLPLARAWRCGRYRAAGLTVADIARTLSVDRSTVHRLLQQQPREQGPQREASGRAGPFQIDLFDRD